MMTLSAPPHLTFEFVEIDFAPGCCALVRQNIGSALRDMYGNEIAECRRFLAALESVPDVEGDH